MDKKFERQFYVIKKDDGGKDATKLYFITFEKNHVFLVFPFFLSRFSP